MGKAVKGRTKPRARGASARDGDTEGQLKEDIRMLEEYEKLAKLAEIQKLRLKKLQQQEQTNSRINKLKLRNIHRAFMRVEKTIELRKEMELLKQGHERNMERNDALIEMLLVDLDDAEEQHQTAQRAHMNRLERLRSLHAAKVAQLEAEFERDLKALKAEFETEFAQIRAHHLRDAKEMKTIIAAIEAEETERVYRAKQQHENEREMIRNKNLESINELRINLENRIEELEKTFDEAHQTYVEKVSDNGNKFKQLEREDIQLSKRITECKRLIERKTQRLQTWKQKLERNAKEGRQRNAAMKEQKEAIARHCNALKARMARFRQQDAKRLTELTVLSREALRANEDKLSQAERILQLAELGRKFETEREKVLPFYESTVGSMVAPGHGEGEGKIRGAAEGERRGGAPESKQVSAAGPGRPATAASAKSESAVEPLQPKALLLDGSPVDAFGHLENFFKRYNKVLLDTLAIKQERQRLLQENQDLRAILKSYLDGISVSSDTLSAPNNSLLIVNGRMDMPERTVRRLPGSKTVVEGTQVVQQYAMQARR